MPWTPHFHWWSNRWVLKPEPCDCADENFTTRRELLKHSLDSRLPATDVQVELAMSRLTYLISRLPAEIKQLVFDILADDEFEKYGHVERLEHIHYFATDMLKPLPSIETDQGTIRPSLDFIAFAEEAIAKNAIVHITTDLRFPLEPHVSHYAKKIRNLSITAKGSNRPYGHEFSVLEARAIHSTLSYLDSEFPSVESVDVILSNDWWKIRVLQIMEAMIPVRKMLCVHDQYYEMWVWHGPF